MGLNLMLIVATHQAVARACKAGAVEAQMIVLQALPALCSSSDALVRFYYIVLLRNNSIYLGYREVKLYRYQVPVPGDFGPLNRNSQLFLAIC